MNSIKDVWKAINKICSTKNKVNKSSINHLTTSRGHIDNQSEIAEEFNKFFCEIGTKLASAIPASQNEFSKFLRGYFPQSMFLSPASNIEVFNLIVSLRKTGSTGPDEISVKLIQLSVNYIVNPLNHIINKSFNSGVFATSFKNCKSSSYIQKRKT